MWRRPRQPRIDLSPVDKEKAMMNHPDLMLNLANDRRRELIAEADRAHLLSMARVARRARKTRAVRGQPAGTLASCEPSAMVPAR
jgi:hypothetical protein